jgi:ketosteroid isomerase-like protein
VSEQRVELVRQGYEAWNSGDRKWVLEHMSPDVEWIPPPEDPEPRHYHGFEGVQAFWNQWRAAVGRLQFRPLEYIDAGDHVVVCAKRSGVGEQSGLEISDTVFQVYTFAGPKCVKVQEFYDRPQALRSAGIAAGAERG